VGDELELANTSAQRVAPIVIERFWRELYRAVKVAEGREWSAGLFAGWMFVGAGLDIDPTFTHCLSSCV